MSTQFDDSLMHRCDTENDPPTLCNGPRECRIETTIHCTAKLAH